MLNLRATPAPDAAAAAEYYPAAYWYAMMRFPDKSEFPAPAMPATGSRLPMRSQHQWLDSIKTNGCWAVMPRHQGDPHHSGRIQPTGRFACRLGRRIQAARR